MSWGKRDRRLIDRQRLITDLQQVEATQVSEVAQARTISGPARMPAFYRALRHARASRRYSVYDSARAAKEGAWQATPAVGPDRWSFSYAAFEAALALGTRDLLNGEDYERLVAPMALAIPWLLEPGPASRLSGR